MIHLLFIRSGSKGNATLIDSGNALIQIDMGVPLKYIREGCSLLGKTLKDIQGVFYTHNHSDHIKDAHKLRKYCPAYADKETADWAEHPLYPGVGEQIGDLLVFPFSVSHDAPNPLNFLIYCGDTRVAYITDTGYLSEENLHLIKDCDYYLIESNHDIKMERNSGRPRYLINRVLGEFGHLSNIDSALYMSELVGPKTKGIYLGHLSDDCNTHEIALETHRRVYEEKGIDWTKLDLRCTSQQEIILGGDPL